MNPRVRASFCVPGSGEVPAGSEDSDALGLLLGCIDVWGKDGNVGGAPRQGERCGFIFGLMLEGLVTIADLPDSSFDLFRLVVHLALVPQTPHTGDASQPPGPDGPWMVRRLGIKSGRKPSRFTPSKVAVNVEHHQSLHLFPSPISWGSSQSRVLARTRKMSRSLDLGCSLYVAYTLRNSY